VLDAHGVYHGAALTLSGPEARQDEDASLSVRMLADIHQVFSANETMRYRTADLISELCKIEESPWGDWFGETITPQTLSKFLHPSESRRCQSGSRGRRPEATNSNSLPMPSYVTWMVETVGTVGTGHRAKTTEQNLPSYHLAQIRLFPSIPLQERRLPPTAPTAQHSLDGSTPQPVPEGWNQAEQEAALDDVLRSRRATA
jgi:hypothetical protein